MYFSFYCNIWLFNKYLSIYLSSFNLLYNSGNVLPLAAGLVSSANMLAVVDFKQFGKSFTYSRNIIIPRLEPCGTPQETVRHFDVVW